MEFLLHCYVDLLHEQFSAFLYVLCVRLDKLYKINNFYELTFIKTVIGFKLAPTKCSHIYYCLNLQISNGGGTYLCENMQNFQEDTCNLNVKLNKYSHDSLDTLQLKLRRNRSNRLYVCIVFFLYLSIINDYFSTK